MVTVEAVPQGRPPDALAGNHPRPHGEHCAHPCVPIAEPAVRVHVCHHQPGAAASGDYPSPAIADDVLLAITHALGEEDRVGRIGSGRRIDSRDIVRKCVDYANSVDRIPSISELCLAAHVSERRLRKAFTDEFDLPPSQYFRAWALDVAHTRLAHGEHDRANVTEVAYVLGFNHLGRFAGHYKQIYGESPSVTVRGRQRAAPEPVHSRRSIRRRRSE
jgi:AraC-like DNA-binding protein